MFKYPAACQEGLCSMGLVSLAGAEGSHAVGSSGITRHYIHSKAKTFISNVMSRRVKEWEEM
jgi:hypothetical protein